MSTIDAYLTRNGKDIGKCEDCEDFNAALFAKFEKDFEVDLFGTPCILAIGLCHAQFAIYWYMEQIEKKLQGVPPGYRNLAENGEYVYFWTQAYQGVENGYSVMYEIT